MDIPSGNSSSAGVDLEDRLRGMRKAVENVSIAILIVCGAMLVFIYRQATLMRTQTAELSEAIMEFERSGAPAVVEDLRQRLFAFSREHPDFKPIFTRYFGTNEPAAVSSGPVILPPAGGTSGAPAVP